MREFFGTVLYRRRRLFIAALHLALVAVGFALALGLRYDFQPTATVGRAALEVLPVLALLRLAVYAWMGLFHGYWQHFGFVDLLNTAKAATLSSVLFALALALWGRLGDFPPTVLLLDWLLAVALAGGVHFAARCVRDGHIPLHRREGRRTLIIGAGEAAERLLRQFQHDLRLDINPVCLVDDAPGLANRQLHGVPVVGTTEELPRIIERFRIALLVIAVPSATPAQLRALVNRALATGVAFKVVRPLRELIDGRAPTAQRPLRDVQLEDLLGRPPVALDMAPVARDIAGRVVLVTGGAGSIGSELARQLARLRPARLVLFDQAESPLYFIDRELRAAHPSLDIACVVGSISDPPCLQRAFAAHRPEYVFHAAAYKHVPLMEANVLEAVRTNIFGTRCVARAAVQHGVRRFVLLSTDKAVRPSSVMGATKYMAERILLSLDEFRTSTTEFRAVRFGNVLGSEGSVVPLFRRQLARGGPLTVTHPDVVRYFMTIPEAVHLVLQAASLTAARGRIVILEMGEPVRILDLAENLIRLSGLEPYSEIGIEVIGLRPGEKLREELTATLEESEPAPLSRMRLVSSRPGDGRALRALLDRLAAVVAAGCEDEALHVLRAGVSDCVPPLADVAPHADLMPDAAHLSFTDMPLADMPLADMPLADMPPDGADDVLGGRSERMHRWPAAHSTEMADRRARYPYPGAGAVTSSTPP